MGQALKNLPTLLSLEKIEEGLFRGQGEDLDLRQVFGGQAVGQALYVAREAVPEERLVYSFHSYSLRPDGGKRPIIYGVETLRDGNNFSARRVTAIQNSKPIFYMTASFQAPEAGFEHQRTMPSAPAPDGLSSETQITQSLAHLLPPVLKDKFVCGRPLRVHPVRFHNPLRSHVAEPYRQVWVRVSGSMSDDLCVHQYLPGYASGLSFLPIALQPHDIGFLKLGVQIAAIDYSMQFHRPFNLNEWLLYSVESTSTSNAHDFMRDELRTQNGVLVASAVQEGVMRNHNQKNSRR